jgi:hypothetical protein
MEQDTGKFRTNTKDQYYTRASVAESCVAKIRNVVTLDDYQWIEPSAGNGVFLHILPQHIDKIGIDLDPKAPSIQRGDFLEWSPTTNKRRIFFGNPPFGRQGSLAKAFIKHAALYGEIIAFILPRSFVKPSMSRAFPLDFHCLLSEDLQKDAFEVNGKAYDVPCVFQIWKKESVPRVLAEPVKESGFTYVKATDSYDLAFKRVGGLAGKCKKAESGAVFNPQYHYFLKLDDIYLPRIDAIIDAINKHIFPSNTVGPRSLSKSETNSVLNIILQQPT